MKLTKTITLVFALIGFAAAGLTGCASSDDYGSGGATYENPDPMTQQMRMQEGMSRVTRSLAY